MDAVKFLREFRRLCSSSVGCEGCALEKIKHQCFTAPMLSEEFVSIVEKWSAEHPRKTRLQDFLEKYPEAMLRGGLPLFLPYTVGYCGDTDEIACGYCMHCSRNDPEKCWNRPLGE